jgi:hypothetical protein
VKLTFFGLDYCNPLLRVFAVKIASPGVSVSNSPYESLLKNTKNGYTLGMRVQHGSFAGVVINLVFLKGSSLSRYL